MISKSIPDPLTRWFVVWALGVYAILGVASCNSAHLDRDRTGAAPATSPPPAHPVFPGAAWARARPAAVGIDSVLLAEALAHLASASGRDGLDQTVVVKDGYVVFAGDSVRTAHNIYSCTKALTSTCWALMRARGIVSVGARAADYEPVLAEAYPEVTLRHFATMTSGYSGVGASRWGEPSEDWGWTPYVPAAPLFAPGTAYAYWDEAQMMYGRVLARALDGDLYGLLDGGIMRPIGVRDWRWGTEDTIKTSDERPLPLRNGCTGVVLDALQLARLGWLFANGGVWGADTLLPPRLVREMMSPQVPASLPVAPTDRADVRGPGVYGYGWWTASPDGGGAHAMPAAPADAAYMSGFNHNVCYVVPSQGLVVVRMGEDGNPPEGKHVVWNEFARLLTVALGG